MEFIKQPVELLALPNEWKGFNYHEKLGFIPSSELFRFNNRKLPHFITVEPPPTSFEEMEKAVRGLIANRPVTVYYYNYYTFCILLEDKKKE